MKNAFYFTSKLLYVPKIFKFLSWLVGHVSKRPDWKDKVNFKFYDFTDWLTKTCNTHCPTSREVKALRQWNLVSK